MKTVEAMRQNEGSERKQDINQLSPFLVAVIVLDDMIRRYRTGLSHLFEYYQSKYILEHNLRSATFKTTNTSSHSITSIKVVQSY